MSSSGVHDSDSDGLDRRADLRQDRADLLAEEDQGDDRDDRDEGEDQRVLRETLAFLVPTDGCDECVDERHVGKTSFPTISSGTRGRRPPYEPSPASVNGRPGSVDTQSK